MSKYDDLVKKLKEIFQIDRPELDFGVYRILNVRVGEINDYLENSLKAKVGERLAASGAANMEGLQKELKEKEAQYRADGMNPDTVPKVLEIREKLAEYGVGTSEHENAVFTHLLSFFSRYYDKGDFISQRRYKGDTYAIPYSGEEVVLHWANKDQYYTKSGENFSNYAFKLDDGRSVRFRLVTADTAKDNRKDNDKDRRFVLIEPQPPFALSLSKGDEGDEYEETLLPVAEENGELVLRFEYKAMPKGSKQDTLALDAVNKVLNDAIVKARWLDLCKREPTEKNPQRTLLEKCLTSYTTKNTADYFIHKDLGGFLRRELDFYIKNEIMHLDDVQNAEKFADIEKNLRLIQTLRAIALDLITFLAQLEDFQKKLWLKKKFVVATNYCITLDRVPESLYSVIAANQQQWEQWKKLGMLDGVAPSLLAGEGWGEGVAYLKAHPYLMADTALFDAAFKHTLLAAVDNLDESLDGLLIHGDNFQALNLLQERYREQVKCVYIDPPYNTGDGDFNYKDQFKHSSWLSLLEDRVAFSSRLQSADGAFFCNIDDNEFNNFKSLVDGISCYNKFIGNVIWKHTEQSKNDELNFYRQWNYLTCYGMPELGRFRLSRTDKDNKNYSNPDNDPNGAWRSGDVRSPSYRRTLCYNIDTPSGKTIRPPENGWRWSKEQVIKKINVGEIIFSENEERIIRKIYLCNQEGRTPENLWIGERFGTSRSATNDLKSLFAESPFDTPKPKELIQSLIELFEGNSDLMILDYFAGSGTTAHAVINLNRADGCNHKYILVEQGDYFETVLKPRIQKVVYSADWKDGKPCPSPQPSPTRGEGDRFNGISHAFKVLKLESYEDTLNNLQLRRTEAQQSLLDTLPQSAKEDYLLRYLLDIESRGSLLSVEQFNKPFDCKLKVAVDSAGAYEERSIDMVETFNYLIGLRVKHIDMQREQGFVSVTGWLPTGEKTLVLWRDVERVDYDTLNRLCNKLAINPADTEFEIVYINGDHNIPAVFVGLDSEGGNKKELKIRQIEPEFLARMFAVEGV